MKTEFVEGLLDVTPLVGARDVRVEEGLFTIVGSTVMLKTVFFSGTSLKGLGSWRWRAILGRLFSKMRRVLRLSMWEYNTPNYLFLLFCRHHQSAHSRDNHQFAIAPSVPHVRFQLSRVANCSYMIVLWDSWRRLMRSCVQVEDKCLALNGEHDEEPEPKEQFRSQFLQSSSRLQPWQSRQMSLRSVGSRWPRAPRRHLRPVLGTVVRLLNPRWVSRQPTVL